MLNYFVSIWACTPTHTLLSCYCYSSHFIMENYQFKEKHLYCGGQEMRALPSPSTTGSGLLWVSWYFVCFYFFFILTKYNSNSWQKISLWSSIRFKSNFHLCGFPLKYCIADRMYHNQTKNFRIWEEKS